MNIEQLGRIDLNLLVCLNVLLEERNVTRTASRLCLTQSAVSKSLAKLRTQFDDPLFYRSAHGLNPTPRALFLKPKLEALIYHLESITQPETFDPKTSKRRFHIALVESVYPLILPHFLPSMFQQSPGIKITTHPWKDDTFKLLQSGDIDFGITGKDIDINDAALTLLPPSDIDTQEIYRDQQVCLVRKYHPVLSRHWDLDAYLAERHVQVRCDGNDRWLLDYKLADIGLERDIALYVPDFNSAASLCTYTDFVFTAPMHFAQYISSYLDLVVLPLPTELPPMAYTLFWHKDRSEDAALSWFHQIIKSNTLHLNSTDSGSKSD
ncbi:LysR family transcriptional regulator [Vibrio nigripulchritudo ATCC 27043]|uniref:LysR family transcriptional regulator n=1 Tax=Vibrio nigripulchritudo TaxID=28173 RepID=UPI00021C0E64|nr:LysR family transcriptional regulator [Vibrio nigripulchritudo]EGU54583.1 LysR family transcriptional regulator [Vibrio nigripulchritudo ATCC 27043]